MKLKLKEYCNNSDISLTHLSKISGVPRVSLSRYAHGVQSPTLDQFSKIVTALGCDWVDLLDDWDEWQKVFKKVYSKFNPKEDKSWVGKLLFISQRQYDHVEKV